MKTRILTSLFLAAGLFMFGINAAAQQPKSSTPNDSTAPCGQNPGMMGGGMMGHGVGQDQGMMGGKMEPGMMGEGMMSQMAAYHQQMTTLMNKLMQSMAAMQTEKDPEALKSKLAAHDALLKQMHKQMMQHDSMMKMMSGQMKQGCPGASEAPKPNPGG